MEIPPIPVHESRHRLDSCLSLQHLTRLGTTNDAKLSESGSPCMISLFYCICNTKASSRLWSEQRITEIVIGRIGAVMLYGLLKKSNHIRTDTHTQMCVIYNRT